MWYKIGACIILTILGIWILMNYTYENRYYCGLLKEKPRLYHSLEPNWFGNTLQFNKGYKAWLVSGGDINNFSGDLLVDGSSQYSVIVAYTTNIEGGLIFKAINKNGGISTYRYEYINKGIVKPYNIEYETDHKWYDVTITNCKAWFVPNIVLPNRINWK